MKIRTILTIGVPALLICSAASAQIQAGSGLSVPGVDSSLVGVVVGKQPTTPDTRPQSVNPLKAAVAHATAPAGIGISDRGGLTQNNGVVVTPPAGAPAIGIGEGHYGVSETVLGALGPK